MENKEKLNALTKGIELKDDELSSVTGGAEKIKYGDCTFSFDYPIGHHVEICDCIGFASNHRYTHGATLTKYGIATYHGEIIPVLYFRGDSDVEGWYPQRIVPHIHVINYADTGRISNDCVIVLKG